MSRSRKRYVRSGDYMEVTVPRCSTYDEVARAAFLVLDIQEEEEEGEGRLTMFRIDGTVIPDGDIGGAAWTIARYLKSLNKSPGQIKLGVGYYYRVN